MIYAAFHKGDKKGFFPKLLSGAIKWWTHSEYSHVELYFESTGESFSAAGLDGKVRFKNIRYSHPERWTFVSIPWANESYVRSLAKTHVGDRYDYKGIFLTFVLPLRRQDNNKWWCSEICAFLIGLHPFRISPGEMYIRCRLRGGVRVESLPEWGV